VIKGASYPPRAESPCAAGPTGGGAMRARPRRGSAGPADSPECCPLPLGDRARRARFPHFHPASSGAVHPRRRGWDPDHDLRL